MTGATRGDEPLPWVETASRGAESPLTDVPSGPRPLPPPLPADLRPGREVKALRHELAAVLADVERLRSMQRARKGQVLEQFALVRDELVDAQLATIAVERLKDATEGRLRLGQVRSAGYRSVADVLRAGPHRLQAIPGVGAQTATQTYAAARHLAATVRETMPLRLDAERRTASHGDLLSALRRYEDVDRVLAPLEDELSRLGREVEALLDDRQGKVGRLRWLFLGAGRKEQFRRHIRQLDAVARDAVFLDVVARLRSGLTELPTAVRDPSALWRDFEARAPDYYGLLGELADLSLDVAAGHGHIPAALAERIAEQQLDQSQLTVSLRGYQSFGAKFVLVQRRCILGDEMGLGKTVEALAVMAHLAALGDRHFVVVCPASVLVNWTREVRTRSRLAAHRVHGPERQAEYLAWQRRGGVAITTYETLRSLPPPESAPALVTVDEAHFVKNPAAARSKATRVWTDACDRVVFLTGTAMENRVEEFRTLVGYLKPEVARSIRNVTGLAGAASFRGAVAPVYLRRNQEDVLAELPERLDALDWVDMTQDDVSAYRAAVAARNFMAMRRAAYDAGTRSAKVHRLLEIVDESASNGWKVVVFSYFRDVLLAVEAALGGAVHGPLTGSTAPTVRQELLDRFQSSPGHAVLLSQIQAGGTGLNMQAASVVILTEPQWKPSIEQQAIARCHRMGQVRRVHVHRLLAQNSVDQRMLEILQTKRALFDEYVRRSALKEISPDAVDVADTQATRLAVKAAGDEIIEQERRRLGL